MRSKFCERFVGDESVIYGRVRSAEGKAWEVGLQGRETCCRNGRGEVDGGCLECRHIAQRGPGKKALQPRLSVKF